MKYKFLFIISGLLLMFAFMCGCGNEVVEQPEEVEDQTPQIIHIYSTSNEIEDRLEYLYSKHSEYKERVEVIVLPKEGYKEAIDALLENKEEKCPDVIVADYSDIGLFTDAEYTCNVLDTGLNEDDLVKMYPFSKEVVTNDEGILKAIAYKVNPGAFVYRKSLALEYLGYDDEENVQSFLNEWDTFVDTARSINKKSEGNIKMLASADAIDMTYIEASLKSQNQLQEDSIYNELVKVKNTLVKNKFIHGLDVNSDQYIRVANKGNVFGYFCTVDTLSKLNQVCSGDIKGDWGVCKGPKAYIDGGSWIFVTSKCADKELTGTILKMLTSDSAILKSMYEDDKDFVNNTHAMSNAYNTNVGKIDLLGGEDYIKTFDKTASKACLTRITPEPVQVEETAVEEVE